MTNSKHRVSFIILAAFLLVISGRSLRETSEDKESVIISNKLPPSMQAASVALGPLKGLLVDSLWWRSERMLEDKEFFESQQLAEWITSLQPTYPSVWNYQGFNLAFNISHNFSDYEERWEWIHEGIKLLRDKGMRYNPDWERNRPIRTELVHIFFRKIEGISDVESRKFQDKWTLEMLKYLNRGDREELKNLSSAPKSQQGLLRIPEVKEFSDSLKSKGIDLDVWMETSNPGSKGFLPDRPENRNYNIALTRIITYIQRKAIEENLNMDIDRMLKVDIEFGPLDWRTHQAQIIYWGADKELIGTEEGAVKYSDFVTAAMLSSFYNGRVLFSQDKSYFMRTHNIDMVVKLHELFDVLVESYKDNPGRLRRVNNLYKDFLERASVLCFNYNQIDAAEDLFEHYEGYLGEDEKLTFEQFIIQGMERSLRRENFQSRRAFLESVITRALESASLGEWDRYQGYTKLVKITFNMHQKKHADSPARQLPPLEDIIASAKKSYASKQNKNIEDVDTLMNESKKYKEPKVKLLEFH